MRSHTVARHAAVAACAGLALVDCVGTQPQPTVAATGACPEGMVEVPAGSFLMGSPDGQGEADEHPQHRVHLRAYCIDRTEVTVRAYRACVEAGQCRAETTTSPADSFWSRFCNWNKPDRNEHPMNCVEWSNADAYCRWRGGRLPTEAEWEFAARGSDGRVYPWGSEAPGPTLLNAAGGESRRYMESLGRTDWGVMYEGDDGWPTTAPVGSYPLGASPAGALDMAGNVWEWVSDGYCPYLAGEVDNPTGSVEGIQRALRGGGWYINDPSWVRAPSRNKDTPTFRYYYVGFRCAQGSR